MIQEAKAGDDVAMGRIAVVTDSVAGVPAELVDRYHMHVVPSQRIWDGRTYADGADMASGEFYGLLGQNGSLPTTSHPSLADFVRLYARLSEEAEGIISIHVPEELTGAIGVTRVAVREAASVPVTVIDSRLAAMTKSFVVIEVACTAASGGSLAEAAAADEAFIPRVAFLATLDDLRPGHGGRRIGQAAILLGSRLRVSPILSLSGGRVTLLAIARTRRAVRKIVETVEEQVGRRRVHAADAQGDALDEAQRLGSKLQSRFNSVQFHIVEFTPVIGAHTDPGIVGVAFYADRTTGCLPGEQAS